MSISMRFVCLDPQQTQAVEVLSASADERVTPFQLREFAAMIKGESVQTGTLRTWRRRIGIRASSEGFYTVSDLRLLGRYLEALNQGRTTAQFLNQEYGHAEQRPA